MFVNNDTIKRKFNSSHQLPSPYLFLWQKYAKAVSNSEEPKKFEVPNKKAVFLRKKTAFLSGTLNFFGPSYFETALVGFVYPEITSNL